MDFFDKAPKPSIPLSEYAFFLFMPNSGPARCFTFHRIADIKLYFSKTFEVYKWNNAVPGFRTGKAKLKFDPKENRFQASGDVNVEMKRAENLYRVQGNAFDDKFDVIFDLGAFREKKSWHPKASVRIFDKGLIFDTDLNHIGSLSMGKIHTIFSPYTDRLTNEKGRCYVERLSLTSMEANFWRLFDVFFEDGSFFTHWEIPYYNMFRGFYLHHPTGEIRCFPEAKTTIGPDWRMVECTDGENTIKAVAKGLWPVHRIPFRFGPLEAEYHQAVGQLAEFKYNGQSIEQGGIVYADEVPHRIGVLVIG